MEHLSKFHLNRTLNEPGNAVLQKLRKPKKWWRLMLRNQKPGTWRYKTSARWYLLREKYKK